MNGTLRWSAKDSGWLFSVLEAKKPCRVPLLESLASLVPLVCLLFLLAIHIVKIALCGGEVFVTDQCLYSA